MHVFVWTPCCCMCACMLGICVPVYADDWWLQSLSKPSRFNQQVQETDGSDIWFSRDVELQASVLHSPAIQRWTVHVCALKVLFKIRIKLIKWMIYFLWLWEKKSTGSYNPGGFKEQVFIVFTAKEKQIRLKYCFTSFMKTKTFGFLPVNLQE